MSIILTGLPVRPLLELFVPRLSSVLETERWPSDCPQLAGTYPTKRFPVRQTYLYQSIDKSLNLQFALRMYGQAARLASFPLLA